MFPEEIRKITEDFLLRKEVLQEALKIKENIEKLYNKRWAGISLISKGISSLKPEEGNLGHKQKNVDKI